MRKGILAIAAAGSVFALTAAFATGITLTGGASVKGQTSSTLSVTSSVCHDTFAVGYTLDSNGNITHVLLTDSTGTPTAGCKGASAALTMTGNGSSTGLTATALGDATTGNVDFNLSGSPYVLGTLSGIGVVITGA